jgi:5-methylcytosine-specific restriction endonuclease McrA
MRIDAYFCSTRCNSSAHQMMRRMARRAGESRDDSFMTLRSDLLRRDGSLCYLCGVGLSLTTSYPDPLFASVDHVLALANGGSNDPMNLRLAHLVCNTRKRAYLV